MITRADIAANLIDKADAGARLFFAIHNMPRDNVTEVFKHATDGFLRAYRNACRAYGVTE